MEWQGHHLIFYATLILYKFHKSIPPKFHTSRLWIWFAFSIQIWVLVGLDGTKHENFRLLRQLVFAAQERGNVVGLKNSRTQNAYYLLDLSMGSLGVETLTFSEKMVFYIYNVYKLGYLCYFCVRNYMCDQITLLSNYLISDTKTFDTNVITNSML